MTPTADILRRIIERKTEEVWSRAERFPLRELRRQIDTAPETRGFAAALRTRVASGKPAVIAEIKRASPSKGVLRKHFDVPGIARSYQRHGATCLSVLTDVGFFQGADEHLIAARAACTLPVLRKDFVIDQYQIYEARMLGADCILLIAAALGDTKMRDLAELATELGMDTLVEVHKADELERALASPVSIIGVNNRDLRTFRVDLTTTTRLASRVPKDRLVVAESGVLTTQDVERLRAEGAQAFLIGEAFMKAADPGLQLASLFPPGG